jgi:hypothetical protein
VKKNPCPAAPASCSVTPTEYDLAYNTVVKVRVRAGNSAGQGKWSDPNSDSDSARIRNRPSKMDPPRNDFKITVQDNQIAIIWD